METPKTFTAYITKYALTTGIETQQVKQWNKGMVSYELSGRIKYAHGKDWHITKEAAILRAEQMRSAKLKCIQDKINKLNGLKFEI